MISTVAHVNLRGDARQALEFYRSVFGGELVAVTYADAHSVRHPDEADQIMWGQVTSSDGFRIMAYDVPSSRPWSQGDAPFFVSVRGADAHEITDYWKRLTTGSTVIVDLAPAAWSPLYGMLTDPFGITWVLDVTAS
ncbi:VOC family protein [Actinocorallia sp. API 0066]|uniref:VOC family protein n=1 Tax=Actinocorallia sp. API 0066 TaxID=2896846 RepID=UPI001E2FFA51|nr:VOC family protein [Actinocorallia sp. API 0066]MCD0449291.1 VOC family protein [Actinocorallia sp. API 0066]